MFISGITFRDNSLPTPKGALPQERVVERNRMWVATERRGWCPEVP